MHPGSPKARFTRRQCQVVALIAAGYSNEEIARALGLSVRTVRAHSDALRHKLNVRRSQLPFAFKRATGVDPLSAGPAA